MLHKIVGHPVSTKPTLKFLVKYSRSEKSISEEYKVNLLAKWDLVFESLSLSETRLKKT